MNCMNKALVCSLSTIIKKEGNMYYLVSLWCCQDFITSLNDPPVTSGSLAFFHTQRDCSLLSMKT